MVNLVRRLFQFKEQHPDIPRNEHLRLFLIDLQDNMMITGSPMYFRIGIKSVQIFHAIMR